MLSSTGQLWLEFLARHPWTWGAVVASVQIVVIALVARLAASLCQRDPQWQCRIWLLAIGLTLVVVPLHWFSSGWTYSIRSQPLHGLLSNSVTRQASVESSGYDFGQPLTHLATPLVSYADLSLNNEQTSGYSNHESTATQAIGENQLDAIHTSVDRLASNRPTDNRLAIEQSGATGASRLLGILGVIYLAGVAICLGRLGWGMLFLAKLARRANLVSAETNEIFSRAAQHLQHQRSLQVRSVVGLPMPLAFGLARGIVLVPSDFDAWPAEERFAVAMHEVAHIKRRDVLGELLVRLMQAVYWFHPVSRYLAGQLKLSRELATDQQVVRCGLSRGSYAHSFLNVLARLNEDSNRDAMPFLPAIAMSAVGDVEQRLKNILEDQCAHTSWKRVGLIGTALLCSAIATNVRLELLTAQTTQTKPSSDRSAAGRPLSKENQADGIAVGTNKTTESDSDLFHRMRVCEVLTPVGDQFSRELTLSGQVIAPGVGPVPGAIVLLRESSTSRISAEPEKYIEVENRHLVRTQDVLARTQTDAEGKFQFDKVKAPPLPKQRSNPWRGDIVAGHAELGVGWLQIDSRDEQSHVAPGLTVALNPTTTIFGDYYSPDERPLEQATISIPLCNSSIDADRRGLGMSDLDGRLDLQASQLTPQTQTDAAGAFEFTSIPMGVVASIWGADHEGWLSTHVQVLSSPNAIAGPKLAPRMPNAMEVPQVSPVNLIAERGVQLTGTIVDHNGSAVANATIAPRSFVGKKTTDDRGEFQMQLTRNKFDKATVVNFYVEAPRESDLLSRYADFPADDLLSGKPLRVELERGIRVTGKVVTDTGLPVEAAVIRQAGERGALVSSAVTTALGEFEILLPRGQHELLVGCDEPGFALPTTRALRDTSRQSKDSPRCSVDVSDGMGRELEPIVVSRVPELRILVVDATGEPAVGATVAIKDVVPLIAPGAAQVQAAVRLLPKRYEAISLVAETDGQGGVVLTPTGAPSESAIAEAKGVVGTRASRGQAKLTVAVDGVLTVVLQADWLLEGRVLRQGAPVAGANVSISEFQAVGRGGFASRPIEKAITDTLGWYRASVPSDGPYRVSVLSTPGFGVSPQGRVYSAEKVAEGKLRVKDIEHVDYVEGTGEIAGTVIGSDGKPVSDVRVQMSTPTTHWVGHAEASQSQTDADGRFHLKKIPPGSYQLHVYPKEPDRGATLVDAKTGDMYVRAAIDNRPLPAIPTLVASEPSTHYDSRELAAIRGQLLYEGKPIAGARVAIASFDRQTAGDVAQAEMSADEQGFFQFNDLSPEHQIAIYTQMNQEIAGVLPASMVVSPAAGQMLQLGRIATMPPRKLSIEVRTFDKSPLPAGGIVYVMRPKSWHTSRLELPSGDSYQSTVVLPCVGLEDMVEISVRVPGYDVLRTLPSLPRDWNHRYRLRLQDATQVMFVLTKQDQ